MALESASFLNDLNTANPTGTDSKSQGDDHLRLIKTVLKATFPNATAAYTFTNMASGFVLESQDAGAGDFNFLDLYRNSASPATNDVLGSIDFNGKDDAGNKTLYAWIRAEAKVITNGSEDGRLVFGGMSNAVDKQFGSLAEGGLTLQDADADNVSTINIGTNDLALLVLQGGNTPSSGGQLYLYGASHATNGGDVAIVNNGAFVCSWDDSENQFEFYEANYFAANVWFGQNSTNTPGAGNNTQGAAWSNAAGIFAVNVNNSATFLGRTNDGAVVVLSAGGSSQGQISISGATTTYGAFAGSHWSQLVDGSKPEILRGTIVESISQMCRWNDLDGNPYNDERLPCFKISNVEASKKVYGVFAWWDNDPSPDEIEGVTDAFIMSLGAYYVRLHGSQNPQIGDYIESNGDGTGKIQSDSVLKASTVGKITSDFVVETFPDGSKLYCCTLHCG